MEEINKNIKNNEFHRVYLLYGEETYLRRMYKKKLIDALCEDDMNRSIYSGKNIDLGEMYDNSQTMPFFAERKLIVIDNSGFCKNASEDMLNILEKAPETTFFIFSEDEVDKRSKLYKYICKEGYGCELKLQTEESLANWAARLFREENKQITKSDMLYFLSKTGLDMNNIYNEAQKLISYTMDADIIGRQDIDALCTGNPEDKVFDMINAIALGEKDKAIGMYSDLMALRESPMKLLVLISKQFEKILWVKIMLDGGAARNEIAQRLGLRPYFMNGYINQANRFTQKELRDAFEECVKTEADIKMGIIPEQVAVELFILKYCNR